jgi:hypothetical protein
MEANTAAPYSGTHHCTHHYTYHCTHQCTVLITVLSHCTHHFKSSCFCWMGANTAVIITVLSSLYSHTHTHTHTHTRASWLPSCCLFCLFTAYSMPVSQGFALVPAVAILFTGLGEGDGTLGDVRRGGRGFAARDEQRESGEI